MTTLDLTGFPPFDTEDIEVAMASAALYLVVSIGDSGTLDHDARLQYYLERFDRAYRAIKTAVEADQSPSNNE